MGPAVHAADASSADTSGNSTGSAKKHHATKARSHDDEDDDMTQRNLARKLFYTATLLGGLILLNSGTSTTTRSGTGIWNLVQQHEPSLRIFRALSEIVLLLSCTAASVVVWTRYLTIATTARLLFEPLQQGAPVTQTANADDEMDDEMDDQSEVAFQDIHEKDLFQSYSITPVEITLNERDDGSEEIMYIGGIDSKDGEAYETWIPSPMSIWSAALDLLVWILVALVLYVAAAAEAIDSADRQVSGDYHGTNTTTATTTTGWIHAVARFAAPTFPLLLFVGAAVKAWHPWKAARAQFYTIVSYTLSAPAYEVTFRDGMIGDVITSMVRPMQDIAFTLAYLLFGLQGWWSNGYFSPSPMAMNHESTNGTDALENAFLNAADASVPAMERSWWLHTAILPACMISPLWWRFLQNMRQAYDHKQRWPYLGNALKYFLAAQVAMVGVYQPQMQQNPLWLACFVGATLYQIYWDIFLDWGLLVRNPHSSGWVLRDQRLYPTRSVYWILILVNTLLRFCWTLSFVPLHYLSAAGVLTSNFSNDTWTSILAPTIASAEIVRRALWGLLRVEWEAIKVRSGDKSTNDQKADDVDEMEMRPMSFQGSTGNVAVFERLTLPKLTSGMSHLTNIQIVSELSMYIVAFAVLGLVVAAHRGTL